MPRRIVLLALLASLPLPAQNPLTSTTLGGSANDAITGVAVDSSGNIYVAGTTASFDFPILNSFQAANRGTQLAYSPDSGATWNPASNPFPNVTPLQGLIVAADPSNASRVYAGSANTVCASSDTGQHFQCAALPVSLYQPQLTGLAVDPQHPATVYATMDVSGGVFKSTDSGQTWNSSGSGLPSNGFVYGISIDPFHTNVIYTWDGRGGYVSRDSAATWTPTTLPWPSNTTASGPSIRFAFDPVTPGIIYAPGFVGTAFITQKSTDAGQTWTALTSPFTNFCCVVPDPKTSGVLYATQAANLYSNPPISAALWKSIDGGITWTHTALPTAATAPLTIDPNNPSILIASPYRSVDGGASWSGMSVSRTIQPSFSSSTTGALYGIGMSTSDVFLAKFLPDGKTPVFVSYFGGMGNDSANSIVLDSTGNIWIAGSTSSYDFPVTTGAFQTSLKGSQAGFVAEFSAGGQLLASTCLGGSNQDSATGLAIGPQGNPWVIGGWTSSDFPFTVPLPASLNQQSNSYQAELDSSLSNLLFAAFVDGQFNYSGKAIAIDPAGNVIVAGSTYDPQFPITPGAVHNGMPSNYSPKAFVLKTDPSGKTIYSTFIGGTAPVMPNPTGSSETDTGIALAADSSGDIYLTGYTSASDFPTTSGAYQPAIDSNCPYPAFTNDTGLIGTIPTYLAGDSFVLKLDPLGQKVLYSTYIGGSCYDHPTSISVDASGNAYVTGETDSIDYPLVSPVMSAPVTRQFASFVSELNAAGSSMPFSTYLYAGSAPAVALSPNGSIIVAGSSGLGAQTMPDYSFVNPFPATATDGYLAQIQLTSTESPINVTQVRNGFSLIAGPVAAGEIVTLNVTGLNPVQNLNAGIVETIPLVQSFGGVEVTFGGVPAYLMSVSPGQIVCIAPLALAGRQSTAIQVFVNGTGSNILTETVAATALGLLSSDGSGTGLANARNADGTLNSATNPAPAGSIVTVFLTGTVAGAPILVNGLATTAQAMAGFVSGILSCTFTAPYLQPSQTQAGVGVSSNSSQSQNLYIYVH